MLTKNEERNGSILESCRGSGPIDGFPVWQVRIVKVLAIMVTVPRTQNDGIAI
ncbi:Uncharacterised protein [uncultured archaeon]|nr:Uncharacterised protein [uncultured archaeon]